MSFRDKIAGVAGVYCIKNLMDGRYYVGQTTDIGRRWRIHLNSNTLEIQQDIQKLGREHFEFKVLEEIDDPETRLERERYWIKELNSFEKGYNSTRGGQGGHLGNTYGKVPHPWNRGKFRKPHSEETKRKMRKPKKKISWKFPDGTIRKMSGGPAKRFYLNKGVNLIKLEE